MKRRKYLAVILIFFLTFASGCGIGNTENSSAPVVSKTPKLIAHRGLSSKNVDNTAASYKAAGELDFWGIETDLQFTLDGVIICSHDAYPLGHEDKRISTKTWEELKTLELPNPYNEEKIFLCTFAEYLDICKEYEKTAVVELKLEITETQAKQILSEIDKYYSRENVTFISFYLNSLRMMRRLFPGCQTQYLIMEENYYEYFKNWKQSPPYIDVSVSRELLLVEDIDYFHNLGLQVGVWTINNQGFAEMYAEAGVEYITSDFYII